ncbi:MAG: glycosyltransferase [Ginsengibacter sp.]
MDNHLHIVCLDVPYPPDYGGVFDLFYKIKTLHKTGIKIHLHCFEYGRGEQPELDKYCVEVTYYKRTFSLLDLFRRIPYIVSSRKNPDLLKNLTKDNAPVLLEGIHCSYYLQNDALKERKVLLRLHNVEYEYYHYLAGAEDHFLKKIYYRIESRWLKSYEKKITNKAKILTVNEKDLQTYRRVFKAENVEYMPVFLPFQLVNSLTGRNDFCLYQGNLSVPENEKAVLWLLKNVFQSPDIKFVIAGKNPGNYLKKKISLNGHVILVENPDEEQMKKLIRDAHIHLIPSFNVTGIKIKLLNALYNGRFIIANAATLDGTGLNDLCVLSETPAEFQENIQILMQKTFTEEDKEWREKVLGELFNNDRNARLLIKCLFD